MATAGRLTPWDQCRPGWAGWTLGLLKGMAGQARLGIRQCHRSDDTGNGNGGILSFSETKLDDSISDSEIEINPF